MEGRDILYENERVWQLQEMFPDFDENVIYEVLVQCGDNIQNAAECLFAMKDSQPGTQPAPKESFMGLNDHDLITIRRDLDEEQQHKLEASKTEDQEIMKAISESMKQLKIDEKKHEKEAKRMEKEEKEKKKQEEKLKKNQESKNKLTFGQKVKNFFSRKKKTVVETSKDIEIPDIKYPPESIQN
jgi:hypothetical protein